MGYRELRRLAREGWAAAGKPEFGAFKYVHTNPDFSTSGLSAVAASYYAAAGKREGLTEQDVQEARPAVRRLERSIVHYGDTTLFISEQMAAHGLALRVRGGDGGDDADRRSTATPSPTTGSSRSTRRRARSSPTTP